MFLGLDGEEEVREEEKDEAADRDGDCDEVDALYFVTWRVLRSVLW